MKDFIIGLIYDDNGKPSEKNILTLLLTILILIATIYDMKEGWGNYVAFMQISVPSLLGFRAVNYGIDSLYNSPRYQPYGHAYGSVPTTAPTVGNVQGKGTDINVR